MLFILLDNIKVNRERFSIMQRILAAAVALIALCSLPVYANPPSGSCAANTPWGVPQTTIANSVLVCRSGYALLHDNNARVAAWVSYTLDRERVLSCAPRIDGFSPDPLAPRGERADTVDYRRSGYDMGHMAPNADQSWHPQVQKESFYLSNAAPQLPNLNRGLWRELEAVVRSWAYDRGNLTIYVGSIYNANSPTIGVNRVVVPTAFYKIVVDNSARTSLAFLFPHKDALGDHIRVVQTNVAEIEQQSGIAFSVPDSKTTAAPLWPINTRGLAQERARLCRN